jgi:hypothetical protein
MKVCYKCKIEKGESEFFKQTRSKDGLQSACKDCCHIYAKIYNKDNQVARSLHAKEYRKTNKAQLNAQKVEYFKANRDKIIARRRERRNSNPLRKLMHRLRGLTSRIPQRTGARKIQNTLAILGADLTTILNHLGGSVPDGFHIDHICPLAQARTEEELYKLNHYTNLQCLPKEINMIKGGRYTEAGEQKCIELLGRPWDHTRG